MVCTKGTIAVIGGGASGLAAAIAASRGGATVDVFESHDRVGDSIRVTGDGRCNIGNASTAALDYHNGRFVGQAFTAVSPQDALAFLGSLGLLLRKEQGGRLYPLANKATSVIDALRLAAARANVQEHCDAAVRTVRRAAATEPGRAWRIVLADGSEFAYDSVVLACGGGFAHGMLPDDVGVCAVQPLLGPLATETAPLRGLDKVRAKCVLKANGRSEAGEVTFRSYGLSGIAAFNMSRFVSAGDVLSIDFLPDCAEAGSQAFLAQRLSSLQPDTWLDFTCGMLLPLVARAVLRAAGLEADHAPTAKGLRAFDRALRAFPLRVRGIGDERLCQVHRGGVDVACVDPATMQVRGHAGLHVAGEMIDVDGPCGGYNLHWAWVSGIIAGRAAAGSAAHRDDDASSWCAGENHDDAKAGGGVRREDVVQASGGVRREDVVQASGGARREGGVREGGAARD